MTFIGDIVLTSGKTVKEEDHDDHLPTQEAGDETVLLVRARMKSRWVPHFLAMLRRMQHLGGWGSSRKVAIYADGDGDFRPRFEWHSQLDESAKPIEDQDGNVLYDAG